MPAGEISYRIRQAIKKCVDKYFVGRQERKYWPAELQNIVRTEVANYEEIFPDNKDAVACDAKKILRHQFNIFGIEKNYGNPINWHLDPKTGNSWPLEFWGDINYRDGKTIGGIKFAWELNRLHHLPRLAIAYCLFKNREYIDEIFDQLKSWLEANPYPKGINWISGIELGIRIVNVIYALKFLSDADLSSAQKELVLKFISIHGRHLYRYPSRYSSAANHAIAEALGLFAVGLCFPEIRDAARWKAFGKKVLEREVVRQIYPDGSSFEHSVPYLQFVLDHFLIYYLLCREYHEPCSAGVEERLNSAFEFISGIVDVNGNYPVIGDDDDGFLLKLWFGPHNNFLSLLNTGAVLFDRPEWVWKIPEFDHKTFLLLGTDAKSRWEQLKARKRESRSEVRYFKDAGLAVFREKTVPQILFVGNSGPLGLKPLAGHGHADALSFWLSIGGQPIFVDPGTYLYHSGGKWRSYFRSTTAHNTIRIDWRDQARIISDFMFEGFYNIVAPLLEEDDDRVVWSAGHDGYGYLDDPVFHRRQITYLKSSRRLVIEDHIRCDRQHMIESFFQIHPDCLVSNKDNCFNIGCGHIKITMEMDKKWTYQEVMEGEEDPLIGWYSARFNNIKAAPLVVLRANIEKSQSFTTTIHLKPI